MGVAGRALGSIVSVVGPPAATVRLVAVVIACMFAATWAVGRLVPRLRPSLGVTSNAVVRAFAGLLCALYAVKAASLGAFWLVLVPLLGVIAVYELTIAVTMIWLQFRDRSSPEAG